MTWWWWVGKRGQPFHPPAPRLVVSSDEADQPDYYGHLYDWLADGEDESLLGLVISLTAQQAQQAQQVPSAGTGTGQQAPQDPPQLPVYAVFAGSGRGDLVPAAPAAANGSAAAPATRALEVIVAPLGQGPKPHTPETKGKPQFDPRHAGVGRSGWVLLAWQANGPASLTGQPLITEPSTGTSASTPNHPPAHPPTRRYAGLIVSVACAVLLAGVLIMVWHKRRSSAGVVAEQGEALLYAHIPGTPAKRSAALASSGGSGGSGSPHWTRSKGGAGSLAAVASASAIPKKFSNLPA